MLMLTPEVGIPFAEDVSPAALQTYRDRARALIASLHTLMEASNTEYSELEVRPEDQEAAREGFIRETVAEIRTPASVAHLEALLSSYDHELINVHTRLRTYITNKLIEESANPDAKVRLKALELLGKLSDVAAFTERMRVETVNQSPEELEQAIMQRIRKYMDASTISVQEKTDIKPVAPIRALDVDSVFDIDGDDNAS